MWHDNTIYRLYMSINSVITRHTTNICEALVPSRMCHAAHPPCSARCESHWKRKIRSYGERSSPRCYTRTEGPTSQVRSSQIKIKERITAKRCESYPPEMANSHRRCESKIKKKEKSIKRKNFRKIDLLAWKIRSENQNWTRKRQKIISLG